MKIRGRWPAGLAWIACVWIAAACSVVGSPAPPPGPAPADATASSGAVSPEPGAPRTSGARTPSRQGARAGQTDETTAEPSAAYRWLQPVRRFDEVRGLWVVRSTLTSPAEVRTMVEHASSAGFNTLVVQVRGRGDAFYASDREPRAETITEPDSFDPLALVLEEAHRRGMAVHAWVNTHLVWGPAAPPKDPRHILHAHPDWLAVPRALARDLHGVDPRDPRYVDALRRYARAHSSTVEGIYTSPAHPGVQERVHAVWMDLLRRYDLDGIHFDYIRYASPDFDFSAGTLRRFEVWIGARGNARPAHSADGGVDALLGLVDANPEAWAEFQREQITNLVRRIHRDVKARRPEVVVSAAVFADADDAYATRFQDWKGWLAEGILDIAVPMAYTTDARRFERLVGEARAAAGVRERAWAGIGSYLNGLEGTLVQIDHARAQGTGGFLLFSYDWALGAASGEDPEPFLERVRRERFGGS